MPEFGFPAQPRYAQMRRMIADLRAQADRSRVATVTGRFADLTAQRKGRVGEIMHIEKSIGDLKGYAEAIALSEARAETMQRSLGQLTGLGQSLTDTAVLLLTNGTPDNLANLSTQARGDFQSAVAALNIDFAGRALFAGDDAGGTSLMAADAIFAASVPVLEAGASALAAYADLEAEFINPGGLYDTAFYQGGTGSAPLTEVAPGERIDYGVKADEAPMRRVLLNLAVLGAAFDPANAIPDIHRRELVSQASVGLRSAISQVIGVQSRLGSAEGRIADIKARNIATEATLSLRFNELAGADSYTEAITLTELENQLETAFATTARMASLSLANHL